MTATNTTVTKSEAPKPASVTVLNSAAASVNPARLRKRHVGAIASFVVFVIIPTLVSTFYLFSIANDQFSSRVSFSIRSEDFKNPLDALGSLGQLNTGSTPDAGILNEYLQSQKLLEDLESKVDLPAIYSRPSNDPVFAFKPDSPIEDLLDYWNWMTYITYDAGTGIIDVEAFAFAPEDANAIAQAIMETSSALVEQLSKIAREDATKHAEFELERSRERLRDARVALGKLRDAERIIDPRADLDSQMGVLTALQQQLAAAIIEGDLLQGTTRATDPRLESMNRRIEAIRNRIDQERNKIGHVQNNGTDSLASIVGDYESLLADREFAEQAYLASAISYDVALAEARRKSKYLAAHVPPTLAQSSQYPNRFLMTLGVLGSCLLFWMISVLTIYAMMDRR